MPHNQALSLSRKRTPLCFFVPCRYVLFCPRCPYSCTAAQGVPAQTAYKVGAKVADFALPDENGKTVKLSDSQGRVRVLVFYATWCTPCNAEAASLEKDIWQAYKNKGAQVLGLAIMEQVPDPTTKLKEFRAKRHVTYPLLSDEKMQVRNKFGGKRRSLFCAAGQTGSHITWRSMTHWPGLKKRLSALLAAKD